MGATAAEDWRRLMSARVPPAPRDWVGSWPFPWPSTRSLPDGAAVRACFCLVEFQLARTRSDQPYLRLSLSDRFGPVEARVWDEAEALLPNLRPGCYYGAQGRVEYFNGQLQLCVDALEPVSVELAELELFLPRSTRPQPELERELDALIESITEPGLRALLAACLGPDTAAGPGFRIAPAAKYNHHAYLGGLLEHTVSVTRICAALAEHYGPAVIDRDLLLTAALLHDVGKVREIGARPGFPYTDEGKLLGHILLGLELVATCARAVPELPARRLLLLQHLIAAHQGRYEWQSPREPATIEALLLHYADDLDAKLQQVRELLAQGDGAWTAYDRGFRREFLRPQRLTPADSATGAGRADASANPDDAAAPAPGDTAATGSGDGAAAAAPDHAAPERGPAGPEPDQAPLAADSPAHSAAPGGGRHRAPKGHGSATGFHRLSEDTLDLFGPAGRN